MKGIKSARGLMWIKYNFSGAKEANSYNLGWFQGKQRNWVFATKSDFLLPRSLQPNVVDLRYFKLIKFC